MRLALVFHRFGPYHMARLGALPRAGSTVVGIELSAVDGTYAWAQRSGEQGTEIATVFHHQEVDAVPAHAVFRGVFKALDHAGADCVAVPGWSGRGPLAALAWGRSRGVPAVLMSDSTAHDEPRVWWKEAVKRRVVAQCSVALVGGAPHVEYMAALGTPRERIFTGYDVVDNAHFARGAEAARARVQAVRQELGAPARFFLASNRFIEKKNLLRLLQAFARYRARAGQGAWDLVLLGDGALRAPLERLAQHLDLDSAIHMPGFKQYDELPAWYGVAGAFVHASTTEQWGLVVNEAMAAGLPVIVSNRCGCVPDLVAHGRNGYAFDPLDVDALAGWMLKVASDDCDRAAMCAASREIISRWTPRTFAENLLKAAEVALSVPQRQATAADRALLWALVRR